MADPTDKEWQAGLPNGREWEKAARGVDGRFFPWGRGFKGIETNSGGLAEMRGGVLMLPENQTPQEDMTAYGLESTAGNFEDWVEDKDPFDAGHVKLRGLRGGGFGSASAYSRPASRNVIAGFDPEIGTSFRMVIRRGPGRENENG